MPGELPGELSTASFNAGMMADEVIGERERAYVCEACVREAMRGQRCLVCDAPRPVPKRG